MKFVVHSAFNHSRVYTVRNTSSFDSVYKLYTALSDCMCLSFVVYCTKEKEVKKWKIRELKFCTPSNDCRCLNPYYLHQFSASTSYLWKPHYGYTYINLELFAWSCGILLLITNIKLKNVLGPAADMDVQRPRESGTTFNIIESLQFESRANQLAMLLSYNLHIQTFTKHFKTKYCQIEPR